MFRQFVFLSPHIPLEDPPFAAGDILMAMWIGKGTRAVLALLAKSPFGNDDYDDD